jgi:Uma2 family endonuclease
MTVMYAPDTDTRESGRDPIDELLALSHVLLVAEVISPSGVREEREVKPRACALAGIPFYLLVDRLTNPLTVTVQTKPGKGGYAETHSVPVGAKLVLPEPIAFTLDTSILPLPG